MADLYNGDDRVPSRFELSEPLEVSPGRIWEIPTPKYTKVINYRHRDTFDYLIEGPWFYDPIHGVFVLMYDMIHEAPIFQALAREHNHRKGLNVTVTG